MPLSNKTRSVAAACLFEGLKNRDTGDVFEDPVYYPPLSSLGQGTSFKACYGDD